MDTCNLSAHIKVKEINCMNSNYLALAINPVLHWFIETIWCENMLCTIKILNTVYRKPLFGLGVKARVISKNTGYIDKRRVMKLSRRMSEIHELLTHMASPTLIRCGDRTRHWRNSELDFLVFVAPVSSAATFCWIIVFGMIWMQFEVATVCGKSASRSRRQQWPPEAESPKKRPETFPARHAASAWRLEQLVLVKAGVWAARREERRVGRVAARRHRRGSLRLQRGHVLRSDELLARRPAPEL